ncbi:helix-hairpin-helix domain-containing protein [candidate division KSB1 bacterium]|nr:helix-hairpin-helix domain-containing protein [candidate division KSB1 bacterium]
MVFNNKIKFRFKHLLENFGISRLQLQITIVLLFGLAFGILIPNLPDSQEKDQSLQNWTEEANLLKLKVTEIESLWYEQRNGPTSKPTELFKDKININTASSEEFARLPGIGPILAQRIVNHRNENGKFASLEDLTYVKGIGSKKLEKIKSFLVFK